MRDTARLDLMITPEHPCNYLPDRTARTVFVDPRVSMDQALYTELAQHGFRRSGPHVYRPHCGECRACVPLRVPVQAFQPDRTQKRVYRRNSDLRLSLRPAEFDPEHFRLYSRYLAARHPEGGMDGDSEADYRQFLLSPWGRTTLMEMRLNGILVAVAVTDELKDAFSAVYTFYDPALRERSLGTHAVLMQIDEARRRGLEWLYLGYWIEASRKMSYKTRFYPFETLGADGWLPGDVRVE
ncbi:MAG TPA: arginyltransferase [Gammaproteobacteria bacterium]|jgi:arginine-tRNA-protein transferase|nr:arginyltransferase [Gammaproteobacteria bacterium]